MDITIETLLKQRSQLIEERDKVLQQFSKDINDLDEAIQSIDGIEAPKTTQLYQVKQLGQIKRIPREMKLVLLNPSQTMSLKIQ